MDDQSQAIIELIANEALLEPAALVPDATLESLGIASLEVVMIMFALEDKFGLVVEQTDFEGVHTVADFLSCITGKLAAKAAVALS